MVGRDALREYVRGSLWVLPGLSVLAALAVGAVLSSVRVGARSPLAFQGTPDDARTPWPETIQVTARPSVSRPGL